MHRLSLFFGLLASIIPSLAAPTPTAPLHTYDGPVKQGSYIVKVRDGVDKTGLLGILGSLIGANTVSHQWNTDFYNAFAGDFDQDAVNTFRSSPDVEYVAQNGIMSAFDTQTTAPWNLARISTRNNLTDQNPSHLNFTYNYGPNPGQGVDIYVVDTGIYTDHTDFGGRAKWGGTFCDGCGNADGHGHGTHVAGTAGGTRFGVAKAASLIAVKVLGDDGSGTFAGIIDGLQWVRNQHQSTGLPSIATMSLGGPSSIPLIEAVTGLINSGVHCTVAAGNSNQDAKDTSPANTPDAITVGASDITDARAYYSNYGPMVDIFAPGSQVTSAWNDGGINTISGTSMATPAVAGLVAYYLTNGYAKTPPRAMSALIKLKSTPLKLSNIGLLTLTPNLLAFNDYVKW